MSINTGVKMNGNKREVNAYQDSELINMMGRSASEKLPHYTEPEKTRITLSEKVRQQYNQANALENVLKEIETKMFGDIREDKTDILQAESYFSIDDVLIENGQTLERCLKLAYSIAERI